MGLQKNFICGEDKYKERKNIASNILDLVHNFDT
jgi:hypothetical protein